MEPIFSTNTIEVTAPIDVSSFAGITFEDILLGILVFALGVALVYLAFLLVRRYVRSRFGFNPRAQKHILEVKLPKIDKADKNQSTSKSVTQIQEEISVTETLFSAIGGLQPQSGFKAWLFGRHDDITFELVKKSEKIYFYVAVPEYLREYIEQQIHAQYPEAHIEEIADYNIFGPQSTVLGNYLVQKEAFVYPIKTYKTLQGDPLNAILNTFTKFNENEGAAIQYQVRPAYRSWHTWGVKAVQKMHQGIDVKEAIKVTNPARGKFFDTLGDIFGTKKDSTGPMGRMSARQEEAAKGIEEKSSKAGLEVNVRVVVSAENPQRAQMRLQDLNNAFSQYNIYEYGNALQAKKIGSLGRFIDSFIHREFVPRAQMVMNTEEVTSLFHFPLPFTEAPNINWLSAKKAPAPLNIPKEGLRLGFNDYRGKRTEIRIRREDRRRHMYVIGMTGVGKSWFAEGLAIQDIHNGEGICFIDPHGDAIDHILAHTPEHRMKDVVLFDPAYADRPMALNMLEYETAEQKLFVVDTILQIFDKLYDLSKTGGPMFEQYMRNSLLLIMDDPESGNTIADVPRILADENFRKYKISRCKTQTVIDFWTKEAEKAGGEASLKNMVPYITSKLTPFIANDLIRPIISQQKSSFSFRDAMDNQKIILVKLSKGKIGDLNANLLGMIVINKLLMAALGRANMDESQRKDFYLYIDEFQNFLTDSIEVILSEARKYRLALVMGHQYLGQLTKHGDSKFRDAIFGNVGTKVSFRIGIDDAESMAKEFSPVFNEYDFLNCPKYNTFCKLLIDNANPPPFNMATYPFSEFADENMELGQRIAQNSYQTYCKDRAIIEAEVRERVAQVQEKVKAMGAAKENKKPANPFNLGSK